MLIDFKIFMDFMKMTAFPTKLESEELLLSFHWLLSFL